MRAVQPGSELGADATSQFGRAETFNSILSDFSLPLGCDGRGIYQRYPVNYL